MRVLPALIAALSVLLAAAQQPCDSMANVMDQLLDMYDSLAADRVRAATVMAEQRVRIDSLSAIAHRGNYAIAKAHKEAETLRRIMKGYITIIDSLHKLTRKPPEHPIEARLSRCLDDTSNFSTAAMSGCVGVAMREWESEMDSAYAALMAALSPKGRASLDKSQQAWANFREAAHEQIGQFNYDELQGTMYRVTAAMQLKTMLKQRAEELQNMLEVLNER